MPVVQKRQRTEGKTSSTLVGGTTVTTEKLWKEYLLFLTGIVH